MRIINPLSNKQRSVGIVLALALITGVSAQIDSHAKAAGLAVDKQVSIHQTSTRSNSVTSPSLTTTQANDLLVAFVTVDGPNKSASQSVSSITGGNLTWKLAKRTNVQAGSAEIWTATAPAILKNVTIKASYTGSYQSSLVVTAFSGAKTTIGAVGGASATTGAPSATLTTTQAGSWVWGTGIDWDSATARTVPSGQSKVDEYLSSVGDTYWVQRQSAPTAALAGTAVTINDTAPASDRWNLSIVEILPLVSDSLPPTVPTDVTATFVAPSRVDLTWTASTDNTAVAGYNIVRNGVKIGTSATANFSDTSTLPSSSYDYTISAYDSSGNTSANSAVASVATPADTTAPVISAVTAGTLTQSSAVVTWTTDENANSQVEYGLDFTYGSSTTVDSSLTTTHSQTLASLNPTTTYHYRVLSVDGSGNSSASSDATFTTTAVQTGTASPGISKGVVEDSNAQIGQDAIDMQNAGIKWNRGWLECGYGSDPATITMVQALQSHGVTFLPTYNCPTTTTIASFQAMLTADMNALKPYGVHTWEIGNEMNGGWTSENNYCNNNATPGNMTCAEQAYLQVQKAAYATIHANDPQGIMIYGGLSNWSTNLGPWLTAMKNDQAWQWMDGMGFHPYGGTVSNSMAAMDSLKSYMSQNATWSTKPIWATEVGCWSTGLSSGQQSPCSPKSEAGKYAYLTGLMDAMKAWNKGTSFEIKTPICWYIMHESGTTPGYGLVTTTSPRTYLPAYTAYKNYLGF